VPDAVTVDGVKVADTDWQYEKAGGLLRIHFTNKAAGVKISID
jgi:hypothetical protein